MSYSKNVIKPVYNDHPKDPKVMAVVDRCSSFSDRLMLQRTKLGLQNNGRCKQMEMNVSLGMTVIVFLYH